VNDALGGAQSVLVLGGGSELGLASLRALDLRPGARVLLAGRSPEAMAAAAAQAGLAPSVSVSTVAWDARDMAGHDGFVEKAFAELGDVDVVLAAAGVLGDQERAETDTAHAVDVLETNFVGLAATLLPLASRLTSQGHGVLVVFSSVAGLRGRKANFVYGASKAGLDAFTEGLAASLAGSGVRVVLVRPGFVRGRMTAGRPDAPMATTPEAVGAAVAAAVAGRAEIVHVPRAVGPVFLVLRALPAKLFRRLPG
jgi:decaprenylphospho-beta-D-erythro-pentofuranosid-2-ulose 2-reductase